MGRGKDAAPVWRKWLPRDAERLARLIIALIVGALFFDALASLGVDMIAHRYSELRSHVVALGLLAVIALTMMWPMWAFVLWALLAPLSPHQGAAAVAWMLLAFRLIVTRPWWQAGLVVLCGLLFEVWSRLTVFHYTVVEAVLTSLAACVLLIPALVGRSVIRRRAANSERVVAMEQESELAAEAERRALARDLHDGLAHELSVITLQAMAARAGDAAAQRQALQAIGTSASSAMAELRGLVTLLRDDTSDLFPDHGVPSEVAQVMADTLMSRGLNLEIAIEAGVDQTSGHVRQTVLRVLKESATNILRHAPAGSTARLTGRSEPGLITLEVTNPIGDPGETSELSTGWGLLGIQERISLLGGTFSAGPEGDLWAVRATIPTLAVG